MQGPHLTHHLHFAHDSSIETIVTVILKNPELFDQKGIAWNRSVFDNWTVYLYITELFEIENVHLHKNVFGIK